MPKSVKDLAKWLKDEVEFLQENEDYSGGWIQLGNGLAAVVCWSAGWGEEKRDDCIQSTIDPDYALVAGIKIYNPHDTPDYWLMLSDKEGNIVTEESGIAPDADWEKEAKWLLDDFERVKDVDYDEDGVITSEVEASKEDEVKPEVKEPETKPEGEVEEGCKKDLKENKNDYLNSPYKRIIGEHFEYTGDFEFLDIVADVIDRIEDFGDEEDIWRAIDEALIYNHDRWVIAEFYYSTPEELDWDECISEFDGDIYNICDKILNSKEED